MKDLLSKSSPCLLEPFMVVELTIPQTIMGDLMSDITGKRGG